MSCVISISALFLSLRLVYVLLLWHDCVSLYVVRSVFLCVLWCIVVFFGVLLCAFLRVAWCSPCCCRVLCVYLFVVLLLVGWCLCLWHKWLSYVARQLLPCVCSAQISTDPCPWKQHRNRAGTGAEGKRNRQRAKATSNKTKIDGQATNQRKQKKGTNN